jgi:hypothetical protein
MTAPRLIKFNVNSYVRVRLTDKGRELHRADWDSLLKPLKPPRWEYQPPQENDGWWRTQAWHLMQLFGPHITMGMPAPFQTEILIEVEDGE